MKQHITKEHITKEHITKEQWDELDDMDKIRFVNEAIQFIGIRGIPASVGNHARYIDSELEEKKSYPSIGQMIEFLGEQLIGINNCGLTWLVVINKRGNPDNNDIEFVKHKLIDTLWEAVKHKLNENTN
jgi:hypothetical protein